MTASATGMPKRWRPGQVNPGFDAWMAMMDAVVEDDFLTFDLVDGMPEDPYSEEALRVAEADALARFPDRDAGLLPENQEIADKFIRFIGQVFVKNLGVQWSDEPEFDGQPPTLSVLLPPLEEGFGQMPLSIPRVFTGALSRRTGSEWATLLHNNAERMGLLPEAGT